MYGKVILCKEILGFENKIQIDLSKQNAGLYFVNLYSGIHKKTVKVILL
jgi:hypothetical protein